MDFIFTFKWLRPLRLMNRLRKTYYFQLLLLITLLFSACSLNGRQEKALNKAVAKYTESHNEEQLISYISYIHPNAVAYYLEKGDSVFKERYTLVNKNGISPFLQDGNIREIESDGNRIHVRYQFLKIVDGLYDIKGDEVYIYAVSEDDGKSWYFIDEVDYLNDAIIKPADRLIDPND